MFGTPLHSIGESGSRQNDPPYKVQGPDSNLPFIFADDIFLFTKAKVMVGRILVEFYRSFAIDWAKSSLPTNLEYGFHLTPLEEQMIKLQEYLTYLPLCK